MKASIITALLLVGLTLLSTIYGCFPKNDDPNVVYCDNAVEAYESARGHAARIGGRAFSVADTHSMEPLLYGGDFIVVDPKVSVTTVKPGRVITYYAQWQPADAPPVTHRITDRDGYGLLVAGDNVDGLDHPENRYRVTADNYVGVVTTIYRVRI